MKYYLPKKHKSFYPIGLYNKLKYNQKGDYLEVNLINWLYSKIVFWVRFFFASQVIGSINKSQADNAADDYLKSM